MSAYFSSSVLAIYPESLKAAYLEAGSFPDDCVEIDDAVATQFHPTNQPAGKVLGVINGMPAWVNAPPLTKAELVALADAEKKRLRSVADSQVAWLQDAVDAEIATKEESAALLEWTKYRVLLMRVDTSKSPDIEWPTLPGAN